MRCFFVLTLDFSPLRLLSPIVERVRSLVSTASVSLYRPGTGLRGAGRRAAGFTLIEVGLILAAIGVLSALCLPAYADYTRRTYVSEGLVLSAAAKIRVIEEVMVNPGASTRDRPSMAESPGRSGPSPARRSYELIEQNPSRMVSQIVRAGSVVVITFNRAMDPGNSIEYSLVLTGNFPDDGGKMTFSCEVGPAAIGGLGIARRAGASVGEPLPPEWAPAGCRS